MNVADFARLACYAALVFVAAVGFVVVAVYGAMETIRFRERRR